MNEVYLALAFAIDFIIHPLVVVYFVGGFFFSRDKYPTFRLIHCIVGLFLVPLQALFSFRCPLVVLTAHLRELADPQYVNEERPYLVEIFRSLGFNIPEIIFVIITLIGVAVMLNVLVGMAISKSQTKDFGKGDA